MYGCPDCAVKISAERPVLHERSRQTVQVVEAGRVVDAAEHQAMALVVVARRSIDVEVERVRRVFHVVSGVAWDDGRGVRNSVLDFAERVGGAVLEVVAQAPVQFDASDRCSATRPLTRIQSPA